MDPSVTTGAPLKTIDVTKGPLNKENVYIYNRGLGNAFVPGKNQP